MQLDKTTYMIGYRDQSGEFWCQKEFSTMEETANAWVEAVRKNNTLKHLEVIKCTKNYKIIDSHIPDQARQRPQSLDELLSECVLMEADSQATRTMEKAIAVITKFRAALEEIIETAGDKPYDPRIDITCKRLARKALTSATDQI